MMMRRGTALAPDEAMRLADEVLVAPEAGPWAEDPRREGWWERRASDRRVAQVYRDAHVGSWRWWAVAEAAYAFGGEPPGVWR